VGKSDVNKRKINGIPRICMVILWNKGWHESQAGVVQQALTSQGVGFK
jgi:hypothetical protein